MPRILFTSYLHFITSTLTIHTISTSQLIHFSRHKHYYTKHSILYLYHIIYIPITSQFNAILPMDNSHLISNHYSQHKHNIHNSHRIPYYYHSLVFFSTHTVNYVLIPHILLTLYSALEKLHELVPHHLLSPH